MYPIAARFSFRPMRAVLLALGLLVGYTAVLAATSSAASDDEISRVELLD